MFMTQDGSQLRPDNFGTMQITDANTNTISISGIQLLPGPVSATVSQRTSTNIVAGSTNIQYNSNFTSDGKVATLTITSNPSLPNQIVYVTRLQKI